MAGIPIGLDADYLQFSTGIRLIHAAWTPAREGLVAIVIMSKVLLDMFWTMIVRVAVG